MSINLYRWIVAWAATLLVGLSLLLNLPAHVSAAPTTDSSTNSCLSCHADLYYLHDRGKNYCITEHADRCVNCHQGDPAAMTEVVSHQGLVAHPQQDNGQVCGQCHPQEIQTRLDTFASLAGYATEIHASAYNPVAAPTSGFPDVSETQFSSQCLPWLTGAIVLFGIWLVLVFRSPLKP